MSSIRSLFDPDLPIDRPIEKVITFSNRQPDVLLREAREYVVTDNLASEYEKLLGYFEDAQTGDRGHDCCVWLPGFYGSGKSSFAKYFGLTFDPSARDGDTHFAEHFLKQFPDRPFQIRLKSLRERLNVAVFLLDLAAQGTAGVTHTPISTLLFDQVCAWAGFASDRKIAELETFLLHEGRLDEFRERAASEAGLDYEELASLPNILLPVASDLAHEFYPKIWKSADAFQNATSISTQNEQQRVEQMLGLIEQKTGTKRVLFIVDEVDHFLRNNDSLINNLDGLAKNLKELSEGKAWLIATAQQTLPKTGPLFGLTARFPIKIDLRASDIREITHRRLLRKSTGGESILKGLYGEKLTLLTQLKDITISAPLEESTFVDFYPLLPQQFDILIASIASMAKLQGGIGLRSAIRCVQDILITSYHGQSPAVNREVPALLTCADLYDVLETDLEQAAREITLHVDNVARRHGADSWEHRVAKSIAVLQQIDGFPITRHNLAALLYPAVGADAINDHVEDAVDKLLADALVPIGETDGALSYLSEKVSQIESERQNIAVTTTSRLTVQNRLLRELFQRPPKTVIEGAKTVDSGVCLFDGFREQEITGKDRDIRFLLRLVSEGELDATKQSLLTEARRLAAQGILPDLPDALEAEGSDTLQRIHNGTFHQDLPALTHTLERLQTLVTQRSGEQIKSLTETLDRQVSSLTASSDFEKLDSGRRTQLRQRLDELTFQPEHTLQGVAKAQTSFASTSTELQSIREETEKAARPKPLEPPSKKRAPRFGAGIPSV